MGNVVLVVEDDADAKDVYASVLRKAGFEVVLARTAREALDFTLEHTPAIVVLDRKLSDRDGLEVARAWRASAGRMARVPIIALTSFTTRPDVEAALVAGCDAFLAKPCPGDVLVAHVTKLLMSNEPTRRMPKFDPASAASVVDAADRDSRPDSQT